MSEENTGTNGTPETKAPEKDIKRVIVVYEDGSRESFKLTENSAVVMLHTKNTGKSCHTTCRTQAKADVNVHIAIANNCAKVGSEIKKMVLAHIANGTA